MAKKYIAELAVEDFKEKTDWDEFWNPADLLHFRIILEGMAEKYAWPSQPGDLDPDEYFLFKDGSGVRIANPDQVYYSAHFSVKLPEDFEAFSEGKEKGWEYWIRGGNIGK